MRPEYLRRWVPPGLSLLGACLFFADAAFTGDTFLSGDLLRVYYPVHKYWAARVARGEFPAWYPFDGLGQPFVGMLVSHVFHPINLLFLLLPLGAAMKWSLLLGYAFAGWGMYALLRKLSAAESPSALAAVAYAFCGYSVSIGNNLAYLLALAALPWAFRWAYEHLEGSSGSTRLAASASLALVLFAGDPQAFTVAAGCIGGLALLPGRVPRRSRMLRAVEVAGLAALLGAAQLLPSLALRGEAFASVNSTEAALRWSGEPVRAVELALGPLWLDASRSRFLSQQLGLMFEPRMGGPWVSSQYLGLPVVLLAAWALWRSRRSPTGWVLGGGFGVLVLLWLGRHAGLYLFLHDVLPFFRAFRYPEKLSPFLTLLLSLGAGVGLDGALKSPPRERRGLLVVLGTALICVLLAAAGEGWGHLFSHGLMHMLAPLLSGGQQATLGHTFLRCAALSAAGLALAGLVLALPLRPAVAGWAVAAVCGASLYLGNGRIPGVGSPGVLTDKPSFLTVMEDRDGPSHLGGARVVSHVSVVPGAVMERGAGPVEVHGASRTDYEALYQASALRSDVNALFQLETGDAYLPAATRRLMGAYKPFGDGGLFNTRYIVMPKQTFEQLRWPREQAVSGSGAGLVLARTAGFVERVYLAHPRCVATEEAAVREVHAAAFRRGLNVEVECGGTQLEGEGEPSAEPPGTAKLVDYQPEQVTVETLATRPGMLVLNDAYYSGWTAEVDGKASKIFPANGAVRAVPVPVGTHRVVFAYRAPGLRLGAVMSLLTLLGLCGAALLPARKGSA